MTPRSTTAKIGLVVVVMVAGLTAVAANFGILTAHRSSPDVGVLSATDVADTPASAPVTSVAPVRTVVTTQSTREDHSHEDKRRHDGDDDADD